MNTSPMFDKSLITKDTHMYDFEYWDTVVKTYENKQYKQTIIEVLNYINPDLVEKTGNSDKTKFVISHGSIVIFLDIDDDRYTIRAPFLKMPEQNKVALMRQLTELNFFSLNLTQIVLNDKDELEFIFESPLEMCEPYKIYNILEEICMVADGNDDVFIEKFGAKRLTEPKIERFSTEMVDKAWEKFQAYLKEAIDYIAYFESKNMYPFCWDVCYTTFTKIDYYMKPQGFLRYEIEKAVNELNAQVHLNERVAKAKNALQKFQALSKDKFAESLYKIEVFITEKPKARLPDIQSFIQKTYQNSEQEIAKGDGIGATYTLMTGLLDLFYRRDIPAKIMDKFVSALADMSQKPWGEAATILWRSVDGVMKMQYVKETQEKSSLGKKIWGSLAELMGAK